MLKYSFKSSIQYELFYFMCTPTYDTQREYESKEKKKNLRIDAKK